MVVFLTPLIVYSVNVRLYSVLSSEHHCVDGVMFMGAGGVGGVTFSCVVIFPKDAVLFTINLISSAERVLL